MKTGIGVAVAVALAAVTACSPEDQPVASGAATAVPMVQGQLVVDATCTPCHGGILEGRLISTSRTPSIVQTPSLAQARGYTWPEFNRLLTVGMTRDGRWVRDVMVTTAIYSLPESDRRAVYEYLSAYGAP